MNAISVTFLLIVMAAVGCKKNTSGSPIAEPGDTATIRPAVDPPLANTIGFFLDGWTAKPFIKPDAYNTASVPANGSVVVKVDASNIITKIPPTLFGNNSNTYMTQIVDQPVLLNHITHMKPGLIRFPGGNLSSIFFWNAAPGQAPADAPAKLIDGATGNEMDGGYWYGKNNDGWTLSTDNYYRMLEQTGNKGVITVNYGYARYGTGQDPVATAAHLAAEWVRYDNGRTQYWEIGNESNGVWQAGNRINPADNQDGQPEVITGELYGNHVKIFCDSMRKAAQEVGANIYIGAQLLEQQPASWATNTDKGWNQGVLTASGNSADYYIIHSYFTPYNANSTAAEILATPREVTNHMMEFLKQNIPSHGAQQKPIALTEYNIFAMGSRQMVSHINGMHNVMVIGEMMKNKFGMACRWDLSNAWEDGNDHGSFSQGEAVSGESKWNPRPSFFHTYFFQKMLGDRAVVSTVANGNGILSYASTFSSGETGVTIVNTAAAAQSVRVVVDNFKPGERYYWYTITGGDDHSEFSRKVVINGHTATGVAGGPADYTSIKPYAALVKQEITLDVPARSIVFVVVEKSK